MPVRIFYVEGDKLIGGLESEINKWQKSLGSKASVTHTSTAMTEHEDSAEDCRTRLAVTVAGERYTGTALPLVRLGRELSRAGEPDSEFRAALMRSLSGSVEQFLGSGL
jgi:hypothetical protein